MRWEPGRQGTGYEKIQLLQGSCFDVYLIRYRPGSHIPPHTDPVPGKRHYRLNWVVWRAVIGGHFIHFDGDKWVGHRRRFEMFRPDLTQHSVGTIHAGTRYVLSIGWVMEDKENG